MILALIYSSLRLTQIHDVCRRVSYEISSSSWSLILDSFANMLEYLLNKADSSANAARITSMMDCLETIRLVFEHVLPVAPSHFGPIHFYGMIVLLLYLHTYKMASGFFYFQASLGYDFCLRLSMIHLAMASGALQHYTTENLFLQPCSNFPFSHLRRLISVCHRKCSPPEDINLVKFLLRIIVSSHSELICSYHSIRNQKFATEMGKRVPRYCSLWEVQTVAFSMLGETVSRDGSSIPVDVWKSMIEVRIPFFSYLVMSIHIDA